MLERLIDSVRKPILATALLASALSWSPDVAAYEYHKAREQSPVAIEYDWSSELRSAYTRLAPYDGSQREWYVHVPPWVSIRGASPAELGIGVLGDARPATGATRYRHDLEGARRNEVVLHEVFHVLYPHLSEGQIRDKVRDTLGKQYTFFH